MSNLSVSVLIHSYSCLGHHSVEATKIRRKFIREKGRTKKKHVYRMDCMMEAGLTQKGKESTPQNCLLVRGQVDDTIGDNEVEGRVRELQLFDVAANKRKIAGQSAAFFKFLKTGWLGSLRHICPIFRNSSIPTSFFGGVANGETFSARPFPWCSDYRKNQDRIVILPPPFLNKYRLFQIFRPFY